LKAIITKYHLFVDYNDFQSKVYETCPPLSAPSPSSYIWVELHSRFFYR